MCPHVWMHKPTYRLVHVWRPKADVRCLLQLCSISVWVGLSPCTWNSLNPPSLVSQLATGTPCLCLPNARITGSHCAYLGFTFSKLRFPCLWGNCFIHWAIFLTTTPSGVWEGPPDTGLTCLTGYVWPRVFCFPVADMRQQIPVWICCPGKTDLFIWDEGWPEGGNFQSALTKQRPLNRLTISGPVNCFRPLSW